MNIDGVTYEVDWEVMKVGASFFIPCIDYSKAKDTVTKEGLVHGIALLVRPVVEDGFRGLRAWRV